MLEIYSFKNPKYNKQKQKQSDKQTEKLFK